MTTFFLKICLTASDQSQNPVNLSIRRAISNAQISCPFPRPMVLFVRTTDIKSFHKDKKQNNLDYNINNYMAI